jgi:hypothetical protein
MTTACVPLDAHVCQCSVFPEAYVQHQWTCALGRFYVSDQELRRLFQSTNGLILPVSNPMCASPAERCQPDAAVSSASFTSACLGEALTQADTWPVLQVAGTVVSVRDLCDTHK